MHHLKVFVTVCEWNSITKAAEQLYLAQPAVSRTIKELETEYDLQLFDRISRHLYLTEAGKNLLGYARPILDLLEEMETNLRSQGSTGKLRIGASITIGSYFMPDYVRQFKISYPQTAIFVTIDSSETIEKMIAASELDFALIEGVTHLDSIVSETYLDDELVAVCPVNHRFSNAEPIALDQFLAEPFLLREKGSGTRELFDQILAAQNLAVRPIWESTSTTALVNAVSRGLGLSVLPYILVEEKLQRQEIALVRVQGLQLKRKFTIIRHKNKLLSVAAQAFIAMCRQSPVRKEAAPPDEHR
ncbi:MAG: LysR family transcriptional regulator [Negativicutes bacterium]|nr:LysR family transcriptional regulator [Negativicutes bacterium]